MSDSPNENCHSDKQAQNTDLFLRSHCSRRTFLKQLVAISATGLVGATLLTACGKAEGGERSETDTRSTDQTSPAAAACCNSWRRQHFAGKCEGSDNLSAGDMTARQAVNYVDESPQLDKDCANCRFFKQPATGTVCGGCDVVKGAIAPEGYCNAGVFQG